MYIFFLKYLNFFLSRVRDLTLTSHGVIEITKSDPIFFEYSFCFYHPITEPYPHFIHHEKRNISEVFHPRITSKEN